MLTPTWLSHVSSSKIFTVCIATVALASRVRAEQTVAETFAHLYGAHLHGVHGVGVYGPGVYGPAVCGPGAELVDERVGREGAAVPVVCVVGLDHVLGLRSVRAARCGLGVDVGVGV
ncbi:hypothetical protein PF007_g27693, partial [Phytophthora fragariae]